ncbi:MAG TPA: ankyrin repeat domain-containing protein [Patescibacteria group bacterium]|nr:ankyrin repeat domain-containing protein [Patescibacteria group bacterium]
MLPRKVSLIIAIACFVAIPVAAGSAAAGEIHKAADSGDLAAVRDLLEKDAALLESRDGDGSTPLHIACIKGHLDLARYLLGEGADPLAGDNENSTPLHVAAIGGNTAVTQLFLDRNIDVDIRDDNGMTPLLFAGNRGQREMIDFLLSKGADINARDTSGGAMIHAASYSGNVDLLSSLIAGGADVNVGPDRYGNTPLAGATYRCHTDAARFLLDNGADPNPTGENVQLPLEIACIRNCEETLALLLEKGARADGIGNKTGGPIISAALEGRTSLVRTLVDHGADVNVRTEFGWTPLNAAAHSGDPEIITMLLDRGADPSVTRDDGATPLMAAVSKGHSEAARILAARGSDLSAADRSYGWTALHCAAIRGYADIAEDLIAAGADVNAKDADGKTPLYYASKHGNAGCADCLKNHEGKAGTCEENYAPSKQLGMQIKDGEAYVWHLGHSGWAVKTKNNLLVFDCWESGRKPDEPGIANGVLTPDEMAGRNVTVFVSHAHGDHYFPQIMEWKESVPGIRYVFGFEPEDVENYVFAGPRRMVTVGDLKIATIESNDSGVGFLVETDGVRIFHAGDHANRQRDFSGPYCAEIDYLANDFGTIDIAFLPVSGCGFGDQVAVKMGVFYALEKLGPAVFVPMHSGDNTITYRDYADETAEKGLKTAVAAAKSRGDRFHYRRAAGLE